MAWNPSPEVAVVRDAANKLKSPFAVLLYLDEHGQNIHTASYGKNMALCRDAGKLSKYLLDAAVRWDEK